MSFFIGEAYAQNAAPQSAGIEFFIMIGIFFLIMYFMIIRPQSKRAKEHKALMGALTRGDEVQTNGGLLGKVSAVEETFIDLEISKAVVVKVQKSAVTSVLPKGTLKLS